MNKKISERKSANIQDDRVQNTLVEHFDESDALTLDCRTKLAAFDLAYRTYGQLNSAKSNAVLVCHALSLDQHAASAHPVTGKPGWWSGMIGPGLTLDTDRLFVICPNIIGGCMGSTGPPAPDPQTGKAYGLNFPAITISDIVRAQEKLITRLGIDQLLCVIGGSMGGMQVLQWAVSFPERVFAAVPIATAARHSAQNIAFHEVGRQAIMADPLWHGGRYMDHDVRPVKGLAVARMAAHITYMSEMALAQKFGRRLQDRGEITYGFDADFRIESYLRHQGMSFVDRFDANSYLYITRAMDYFDLAADYDGNLIKAFEGAQARFCVMSFTSDWLFPTADSRQIVRALNAVAADVSFVEITTGRGHDAFLLDEPEMFLTLRGFINAAARAKGIA